MPESPLRSGFGIRDDEEIQEGMTQEEKDRAFELRRLRGMDDYSGAWSRCWIQGYVEEGENFVLLQRTVGIKIVQSGTITASKLVREVTIRTVRQDLGVVDTLGMSVLPKAEVERAREEIKRVLAGLGTLDTVSPFVRLEMERPSRTVIDDEKGLMVSTSKSHSVLMGNECENGNVSVENMTVVRENLPSKIMGADETDPDMIEGLGRVERVQGVRLARQEMRGVWETFREEEGWRELEARTTGIAGASLEEEGLECEYCEVRHRNGNCLLPREVVAS
jgi:hypothetical protein